MCNGITLISFIYTNVYFDDSITTNNTKGGNLFTFFCSFGFVIALSKKSYMQKFTNVCSFSHISHLLYQWWVRLKLSVTFSFIYSDDFSHCVFSSVISVINCFGWSDAIVDDVFGTLYFAKCTFWSFSQRRRK